MVKYIVKAIGPVVLPLIPGYIKWHKHTKKLSLVSASDGACAPDLQAQVSQLSARKSPSLSSQSLLPPFRHQKAGIPKGTGGKTIPV